MPLKTRLSISLIVVFIALSTVSCRNKFSQALQSPDEYFVKYVFDGDTILLSNNQKLRYIGVDTPEVEGPYTKEERMGKEASAFNRKLVEGKRVRLEFDHEIRDKYNRLLAYVFLDDVFVNAELVKQGYARTLNIPPNVKYADLFERLQSEAKRKKLGIWSR